MNLELLTKRKNELEGAIAQTVHNLQTMQGHKSECEFWLGELLKVAESVIEPEEATVTSEPLPVE